MDTISQDVLDVRYNFEQCLLPALFYEMGTTDAVLGYVKAEKANTNALWRDANRAFDRKKIENPYQQDDYESKWMRLQDWHEDVYCLLLRFPDVVPAITPLCRFAYLFCLVSDTGHITEATYYMNEADWSDEKSEPKYFLCSRTKENEHLNFGVMDGSDAFAKAYELFREQCGLQQ